MAAIQLASLAPQPCATGMPNFCSNRFHSSSKSGAELEVTKRSFGRLSRCKCAHASLLAVEQNIDRRRIAGGDRDLVLAQMLEKPAGREFFRQHQRGAAVDHRERAQGLRRVPAERPEIVKPIVGGDAEAFGKRIDIQEIFAEVQNHALGRGAGARGEQDDGVIVRLSRVLRLAWRQAGKLGEQRAGLRLIPASKAQARHGGSGEKIVELEAVLIENEPRLEPLENIAELIAVHLDVHGANGRAGRHHAEITQQMFDRIIGKERDPVVAAESARAQQGGESGR